jgi:hypothetical protein
VPAGEEGFDGRPRGAVREWPEAKRPVVAKLLSDGRAEVGVLEALSLRFRPIKAGRAVVGGVEPVAPILHRPDREAVGSEMRASLSGQIHRLGAGSLVVARRWGIPPTAEAHYD